MRPTSQAVAAIILGLIAAAVMAALALLVVSWGSLALTALGFAVASVSLLLSAKPDEQTKWFELGKRHPRTWWSLALATFSLVLAVASIIDLATA